MKSLLGNICKLSWTYFTNSIPFAHRAIQSSTDETPSPASLDEQADIPVNKTQTFPRFMSCKQKSSQIVKTPLEIQTQTPDVETPSTTVLSDFSKGENNLAKVEEIKCVVSLPQVGILENEYTKELQSILGSCPSGSIKETRSTENCLRIGQRLPARKRAKVAKHSRKRTSIPPRDLHKKFTISSRLKMRAGKLMGKSVSDKKSKTGDAELAGKTDKEGRGKKSKRKDKHLRYPYWLFEKNVSLNCNGSKSSKKAARSNNAATGLSQNKILKDSQEKNLSLLRDNLNNSHNSNFQLKSDEDRFSLLPLLVHKNSRILFNLRNFRSHLLRKEQQVILKNIRKSCIQTNLPMKFYSENSVACRQKRLADNEEVPEGRSHKLPKTSFSLESTAVPLVSLAKFPLNLELNPAFIRINSAVLTPSEQFLLKTLSKIRKTRCKRRLVNKNLNRVLLEQNIKRKVKVSQSEIEILQNAKPPSHSSVKKFQHKILTSANPEVKRRTKKRS